MGASHEVPAARRWRGRHVRAPPPAPVGASLMIYRIRRYVAVAESLPAFHEFFTSYLLPVQLRHGARLVGRWETEDHEVIAVWEYDDVAAYERIADAVASDPDAATAQRVRATLGPLFTEKHEAFARSTVS